ncbi:hypothetical protein T8T21_05750 [Limimaricola variabilis]|uniref:hypothetical protein n=1 Tax=Limimaricola variabilis TaxID=1492771 RepID=UPI002AC99FBE|nr:hypothetical protein [Limimaricola variabilis]WPY95625.1 hypothetical protein T8T21_05750 [Limimaricola variabilis]
MTHIADIPRARTATHWDQVRVHMNDAIEPAPSAPSRVIGIVEAAVTTALAGLLWALGAAILAMALHHLATFGLPFGGRSQ